MALSVAAVADALVEGHATRKQHQAFAAASGIADLKSAYDVQDAFVERLCRREATKVAGYKIGLTTKRMQAMCGIDQPIGGVVRANRIHQAPCSLSLGNYGRLGIEFEIGMRLGRDLGGRSNFTRTEIAAAVEAVCPAIELVDDRNADYKALDVLSLVADNSWNAGIVLGQFLPVWPELGDVVGTAEKNGEKIDTGVGSDVLGHPFEPLVWLANHLAARGGALRAGDIVLTGSMIPTRFPAAGDRFRFSIEGLGAIEIALTV